MNREGWIALGLAALQDAGPAALALNALSERAKATRGSFYHHFDDQADYLAALVGRWAADTEARAAAALPPPPEARPSPPVALLAAINMRLEAGIRALALTHPALAPAIAEADEARVRLLSAAQSDPASDAAAEYARVEHAVVVGLAVAATPPAEALRLAALSADLVNAHWNE